MGDFRKLKAWQKSQELVESVYRITSGFPASERYGLSSQIRRAAVSISANLAEGCGRMGDTELRRFVRISLGSLSELECEILLAARLENDWSRSVPPAAFQHRILAWHASQASPDSAIEGHRL